MSRLLTAAELGFINLVASRRFAGGSAAPADGTRAPVTGADERPFARAATVAAAALSRFNVAPRPTALMAACAQLRLDGFELLAPQGAVAGMIAGLAAGEVTPAAFAGWLEDRAVATASQP